MAACQEIAMEVDQAAQWLEEHSGDGQARFSYIEKGDVEDNKDYESAKCAEYGPAHGLQPDSEGLIYCSDEDQGPVWISSADVGVWECADPNLVRQEHNASRGEEDYDCRIGLCGLCYDARVQSLKARGSSYKRYPDPSEFISPYEADDYGCYFDNSHKGTYHADYIGAYIEGTRDPYSDYFDYLDETPSYSYGKERYGLCLFGPDEYLAHVTKGHIGAGLYTVEPY